jgi:hypothetical protein
VPDGFDLRIVDDADGQTEDNCGSVFLLKNKGICVKGVSDRLRFAIRNRVTHEQSPDLGCDVHPGETANEVFFHPSISLRVSNTKVQRRVGDEKAQ